MAVTGTIFPRTNANPITQHEQKKKNSHATSVSNKQKIKEYRKPFVISNIQYCVHCVISIKESRSKRSSLN